MTEQNTFPPKPSSTHEWWSNRVDQKMKVGKEIGAENTRRIFSKIIAKYDSGDYTLHEFLVELRREAR